MKRKKVSKSTMAHVLRIRLHLSSFTHKVDKLVPVR